MNTTSLNIAALQDCYASKQFTPAEFLTGVYRTIREAGEASVWLDILPEEETLRRAEGLWPDNAGLPLFGVPFVVGNNIDLSALVVERLTAAGAIPVGKTTHGVCAPIAGVVSFGLGAVGPNSGPASLALKHPVCFKPTRGAVSTRGISSNCRTLDCVTILSNTCSDARRVLDCAAGFEANDPLSRLAGQRRAWSTRAFRFGVPSPELLELFGGSSARPLFEKAASALQELGGTRVESDFAILRDAAQLLCDGPWIAEKAASHSALATFEAIYRQAELARAAEHEWTRMDFMLLPTGGRVCAHERAAGCDADFAQLLDVAAVGIPADGEGSGIRLIGPAWSDRALLCIVGRLHSACGSSEPAEHTYCPDGYVPLAVCGAHLAGQPLNHQLTDAGAFLIEQGSTSANYRLYALRGTKPAKPGLVRAKEGGAIELEVWAVPEDKFGAFVAAVPPPLAIGSCTLACGRTVKSFVCEPRAVDDAEEITHLGSWRNYVSRI